MDARTLLVAAREKISNPSNWIKILYGRTAEGGACNSTDVREGKAACFCSMGALLAVAGFDAATDDAYRDATKALAKAMMPNSRHDPISRVIHFNDHNTHDQVLAAFDRAIAAAPR